MPFKELIC